MAYLADPKSGAAHVFDGWAIHGRTEAARERRHDVEHQVEGEPAASGVLEHPQLGRGILLGGVPGVEPAEVLILGGGVVGTNAAKVAAGLGARVIIMDVNIDRLRYLDDVMPALVPKP